MFRFTPKSGLMLAAVLLAGCVRNVVFPAADAGRVEAQTSAVGSRPERWELSASQVRDLSRWFRAHPSGWKFTWTDVAPEVLAYLKRGGRNVGAVNLGPDRVYWAGACLALSRSEREELGRIVGEGVPRLPGPPLGPAS